MKILQITFLFFICFGVFKFTFAQTKPVAMKFDEFNDAAESYYSFEEINLAERIERLIKQINRQRGIKVYLICYNARKTTGIDKYKCGGWASSTKAEINSKTKLDWDDVISVDGGYRERSTIEYWIVPKNAEPPKPTPDFDKSEAFYCPSIYVYSNALQFHKTKSTEFSVSSYDLKPLENFKFHWKVSSGTIIKGQGTDTIQVQLSETDNNRVTAFVEISGLPFPCEKAGVSTIEVDKPYLIDSAERYNHSDLSARMDNFMTILNSDPALKGYIVVYANRRAGTREMERALESVKRVFAFRNYDLSRIIFIRGGFREYNSVDSWILVGNMEPPKPTPTVDKKFVPIVRKGTGRLPGRK